MTTRKEMLREEQKPRRQLEAGSWEVEGSMSCGHYADVLLKRLFESYSFICGLLGRPSAGANAPGSEAVG